MVSIELRELIVANAKAGIRVDEISRVLQVGKSTIWRILKQERETGNIEPCYRGRKSKITPEQHEAMLKLVEEKPDVTLEEMREQLDLPIKKSQISNLLHKAGYHFKKDALCPRKGPGRCCNKARGMGSATASVEAVQTYISGRKQY